MFGIFEIARQIAVAGGSAEAPVSGRVERRRGRAAKRRASGLEFRAVEEESAATP
jgi:hypothetical protein